MLVLDVRRSGNLGLNSITPVFALFLNALEMKYLFLPKIN